LSVQPKELTQKEQGKRILLMEPLAFCGLGTLVCHLITHHRSVILRKNGKKWLDKVTYEYFVLGSVDKRCKFTIA
jgi:hypothetical protein